MTSFERAMTAISHQEPDRVPLFWLFSFYGAKELGTSIEEYFSRPDHVVQGQLQMLRKYGGDCAYTFFYAALEIEAFGGTVVYRDETPPNAAEPLVPPGGDLGCVQAPAIDKDPGLQRVLTVTRRLYEEVGGEVPIVGVVMSPFSLPVMQLGFEAYLEMIYFEPERFRQLMAVNQEFTVNWANAQLDAGATAICFFNPLASPSIIEKRTYLETGYPVDRQTLAAIKGATATHLASGLTLPVVDEIVAAETQVLGFSAEDNLEELKRAAEGRVALLGAFNALEMTHWQTSDIEGTVKALIGTAGRGGGLLLADNHGEIPWQVPEQVLLETTEAVRRYGEYPLKWADSHG